MSNWNHSICDDCWLHRDPHRLPCRMTEPEPETCCFCGETHASGIYVRRNPEQMSCRHAKAAAAGSKQTK